MTYVHPNVDVRTPVVVLNLEHNVLHHGCLGAIRSLGRLGVPTFTVYGDKAAPVAASRYLHGGWIWRPNLDDFEQIGEGLIRLSDRIERPAVVLPTDDAAAVFLAEHGAALRDRFLFPRVGCDLPRRLANKYTLYELCRHYDVPCPAATLVNDANDAEQFARYNGLPVVVKVSRPWGRTQKAGVQRTSIVSTYEQLADIFHQSQTAPDVRLMVQEFIPGAGGKDWFFHGYADGASICRPGFTGSKERSYPAHAGPTSLGRSVHNERLYSQVQRLLTTLQYRGIVDLDLRWDARDDQYKLLDFNPRLGAQFRLFRDTAGVDVAIAAHLDLTGRTIPHGEPLWNRGFLVENYDALAMLDYRRRGEIDMARWLRSLRGIDETAWFARDDLRPFGLMCIRLGGRALRRLSPTHIPAERPDSPTYRAGHASAAKEPTLRLLPLPSLQPSLAPDVVDPKLEGSSR